MSTNLLAGRTEHGGTTTNDDNAVQPCSDWRGRRCFNRRSNQVGQGGSTCTQIGAFWYNLIGDAGGLREPDYARENTVTEKLRTSCSPLVPECYPNDPGQHRSRPKVAEQLPIVGKQFSREPRFGPISANSANMGHVSDNAYLIWANTVQHRPAAAESSLAYSASPGPPATWHIALATRPGEPTCDQGHATGPNSSYKCTRIRD